MSYTLTTLDQLESEAIFVLREVVATMANPVVLYSVGKDSSVLLHLLMKAFAPAPPPVPLLHIDTGFKFPEMYTFRDQRAKDLGLKLIVSRNEAAIAAGTNPLDLGTQKCCGLLKTKALLDALKENQFDCAIGGARRDEEKSRAKERFFSFRDKFGQWDPRLQRPELWKLFNTEHAPGESIRVFPLSNWTELNVWQYIARENIPVVPLYFAQKRSMHVAGDQLIPAGLPSSPKSGKPEQVMCRFRTLGCSPCTGAVRSDAIDVEGIIKELEAARISERSSRVIDHDVEGSMEIKKREGYF